MDIHANGKRGFSPADRRGQLDRSLRPRRVIWSFCHHHDGGYYFYDIRLHSYNPGENDRWADEPGMKKVRGLCMWCTRTSVFFVGEAELQEHRYTNIELCLCGLPAYHKQPSHEFLGQYNASAVPCRPILNA